MAWLNVWRRKARSVLVILMIGVSMSVMLSIQGLYYGMTEHLIESTIRSDSGEISIYAPSYRLQQSLKYHIKESGNLVSSLQKNQEISAVSERIKVMGLASTARKSSMAKLIGIDAMQEERFGQFQNFIVEGELEWGEKERFAVIGKKLAKTLDLKVGSRVVFSSQNLEGDLSSISLRIKGAIQTTNPAIDDVAIFVALSKSEAFTGLGKENRSQLALRIDKEVDLRVFKEKLQKEFPSLDIYTWLELYPALEQMQVMMKVFNGISFGIVMLVVLIGIMGVMLVSILERLREFGILLAVGESYKRLRLQVVIEALILGFSGYILGALLGMAALFYLKQYGLDLSEFSEGLEDWGMTSTIYAAMEVEYFTTTFTAIISAALLSVILPLRRLKKLKPIEVIQGDL